MNRKEPESDAQILPVAVREFRVTHDDGTEVDNQAVVTLKKAHPLHFRLEFESQPTSTQYRVTLVIHKRGGTLSAHSGEIRNAPIATAFTQTLNVQNSPPRLEFDVDDANILITSIPPFHDGPGPYETTIALTPIDAGGNPIEDETSATSYDFTGI